VALAHWQSLPQSHAGGSAVIGALQPQVQPGPGQARQEQRASVFMEILS
jgi:hypothetical protein